jgi:hypothetical protein
MDVPFHSSGALTRSHYTLVRNVENAQTPQLADQLLVSAVRGIRDRFARRARSAVSRLLAPVFDRTYHSPPGRM